MVVYSILYRFPSGLHAINKLCALAVVGSECNVNVWC